MTEEQQQRVDEIKARRAAITPGRLYLEDNGYTFSRKDLHAVDDVVVNGKAITANWKVIAEGLRKNDGIFFFHAPDDVDFLIDLIAEL